MNGASPWPGLHVLAEELFARSDSFEDELADAVLREVPFYRGGTPISSETLHIACATHMEFILGYSKEATGQADLIRQLGAERARDQVPLVPVLDALRACTQYLWAEIVDIARAGDAVTDTHLVDVASEVWLMNETIVRLTSEGYSTEQAAMLEARQYERFSLVYSVLIGSDGSFTLWEAVDALRLPRAGRWVVVAVRAAAVGQMPLPGIEADLLAVDIRSAWVLLTDLQIGIVSTEVDGAVADLRSRLRESGCAAGLSLELIDYNDAPRGLRLAITALTTARNGEVAAFGDQPIESIAAGAPDISGQLAESVLGKLLALPPSERELLLGVLDEWFRNDGSVNAVASAMFVHPNTVRNRMHRIEMLTGRLLSRPRDAAELYLAVSAAEQQSRQLPRLQRLVDDRSGMEQQ
ncbi:MAG TPA: helix-turn-helix domain-containing protein [Galbitalea sp.]